MPIYEYECDKCGHEFEREQRMSDAPVKTCPKCKARKVTKLISRSSFVLKGGGWYADGYSDKKADEKKDKDTKKDEGGKDGKDASKSDSSGDADSKKSGDKKSGGEKKSKGKAKKSAA